MSKTFTRLVSLFTLSILLFLSGALRAQTETEPNNAIAQANPQPFATAITGNVGCSGTDNDDYFRLIIPAGTKSLRLITTASTTGGSGAVFIYIYNKFQNQLTNKYVALTATSLIDTLDYNCYEADTFYVRIQQWAGACKNYSFRVINTPYFTLQNDAEVNDGFATAQGLIFQKDTTGHLASQRYGGAAYDDNDDYYRCVLPAGLKKSLRLTYATRMVSPGATGAVFIYFYNKYQNQLINKYVAINSNTLTTDSLDYSCFEGDTFYVRVQHWSGDCQEYRIKMGYTNEYTWNNDAEPNDNFATAIDLPFQKDTSGHLAKERYLGGPSTDNDDYYRVVMPAGGTKSLRVISQLRTVQPGQSGAVYCYLYNKYQNQLINKYVSFGNTLLRDTLDYTCFEGDTFYVRIQNWSGGCKEYRVRTDYTNLYTLQNDAEQNDGFTTAINLPFQKDTTGHLASQRYIGGPSTDNDDYYRVVLPAGGKKSLRLISQARCVEPGVSGAVYYYFYNKYQNQLTNKYVSFGGTLNRDTLDYTCFEGDTFYVRVQNWSGGCKEYSIRTEYTNEFTLTNDAEPNDNFALATPLAFSQDTTGHLGNMQYGASGAFTDNDDYYRIVAPAGNRSLRLITQWRAATAGSSGASFVYFYNKSQNQITNKYISFGSTLTADTMDYPCFDGDTLYVRLQNWSGACKEYRMRVGSVDGSFPIVGDVEPNNTVATASAISLKDTVRGSVGYTSVGTDGYDYFRFINSNRSRITAYIAYSNNSGSTSSYIYFNFLNKTGGTLATKSKFSRPLGMSYDTLTLNCAVADTLLFSTNASGCFTYAIRFAVRDEQPVAKIKAARTGNEVGFVAEIQVADTLTWTFGNGQTSTFKYPAQTFAPGVYNVKLRATNRVCNISYTDSLLLEMRGIESYKPKNSGAGGDCLMSVYGGGLSDSVKVRLIKGAQIITPTSIKGNSLRNMLSVNLDLHMAQPGIYDVEITLPGGAPVLYPNGFRIDSLRYPYCKAEVLGPTRWRTNLETAFELKITNSGNVYGNGVIVGFAYPKSVTVEFLPKQIKLPANQNTTVTVGTETFTYSNAAMRKYNDSSSRPVPITTLNGKPYDGYHLYLTIPKVPANGTVSIPFKAKTSNVGAPSFYTYTHHPNLFGSCETPHWSNQTNMMTAEAIDALDMATGDIKPANAVVKALKIGQKHLAVDAAYAGAAFDAWWNGYEMTPEMYGNLSAELDEANAFALQTATDELGSLAFEKGMGKLAKANWEKTEWWNQQMAKNGNLSPETFDKFVDGLNKHTAGTARLDKLQGMFKDVKDLKSLTDKLATLEELAKDCPELQQQLDELKKLLSDETDHKDPNDKKTQSVTSLDPNAIYGPEGVLNPRFRKDSEVMHYMVTCENVDTATAPAQVVRIVDTLDPAKFDLSTFEFGNVYIGQKSVRLLSGRDEFYGELSLAPQIPLKARVIAKLDTATGVITWDMVGIDTLTGKLPTNPDLGLLPPNILKPIGEAGVSYSVRLKAGLPSGTQISNTALIYFDDNEPIATNTWSNTLDIVKPQSTLVSAAAANDSTVRLRFSGIDAESGIAKYRVSVRTDTGAWQPLGVTTADTMLMVGTPGTRYRFSVTSSDYVGNEEGKARQTEAEVTLPKVGPPLYSAGVAVFPNPAKNSVTIRAYAQAAGPLRINITNISGQVVQSFEGQQPAGSADHELSTASLESGIYFVEVWVADSSLATTKLVILR